jgi:hypothetical protein
MLRFACYQNREFLATVSGFTPEADQDRSLAIFISVDDGPWTLLKATASFKRLLALDVDDPKRLVKLAMDHKRMRLRVTVDRVAGEQEVLFEIDGLRGAIQPVLEACGWDPTQDED